MLYERTETTSTSADAFTDMVLDYEITDGMVGHILQTGFMNYAGNYAPTGMLYDDVVVAEYTPTPAPTPEPTPEPTPAPAANYAEDDFESYTADQETLGNWRAYVNQFDRNDDGSAGGYRGGYGLCCTKRCKRKPISSVSC